MFFYTFMPKLFNMSLTASVAIVLVILLRLLLKKAPKVISYALWGVVLFRLLCPMSIGSNFSVYNLFDAPAQESGTITSVIEYVPSNIVHTEYPSVALPVPGISDVINEALPQGQEQLVADPLEAPMSITTYIWMIGVLVMVIYSIVSYIRLRRKLSVVVPLRDNIFIADDIKSPFVVGLFRPKIYLPCNLGDKEQEYIILHEQHHIKRLDHVMKALAFLALAIHWFNPLVWVAFILASKDMEMSCDEAVIRKIGGNVRADYSASLLTLATGRRIIAGTPLAFGEGDTKGRINNLSKWKKPAVWVVLVAVVACVVLAVCLLTNPSQTRDTMKWAQSLSVEDVASADLVVYPQTADKQFKQLSAEELSEMVALINESKGKYRIEHEELAGGGISFYITMKDGTSHSVENIGNTYLVIDGEYYEASYNWLNGWSKRFGEGNTRIPDQYFSVPLTLDEVLELSQRGHELIWGDFNSYKYYETGSGLYIRVYEIDDDFSLWIGGSGPEYELEPMYIYLALKDDIDTHIDIRDGNVAEFIGQHRSVAADHEGTSTLRTGDLIPGTTYVSYQCLYMNPLSSYAAMGGDSGCKYIIGEDYFATINRNDGSFVSVTNPNMDIATSGLDGLQNMIEVSNWEWKEFPYTDEEWAALYTPQGFGGISNISEIYDEMLYQPLTTGKFLLKMDNSLWLVELAANQQMGTYLWSIYSLVPESAMGVAQWEYAPMLSSRSPYFRFEFDMDYTEISAVCTQSLLVDRDASGTPSDTSLIFKDGNALYWSPIDKDDNVVTAAIIHFSVHQGDIAPYSGTIYIEGNSGSDGRRIYNATIVGTGLHLEPHSEISGGVVSAIASPNVIRVVEHDLTTGDLEIAVEDLSSYVFYTNSKQISVTVKGSDFDGQVNLLDVSQNNAHILQHHVNTREDDCLFTGLTSARLYRVDCEGLDDCTVVISGDK
jgi:beta-lactamase regulating signal transducer with metallopeptidase domain